jgi:hypothetical protein
VSIRFQADNDLTRVIVDATLRAEPCIDFQTAQMADLHGIDDDLVLIQAAEQGRILVTHDKRTMPGRLAKYIQNGGSSPGVLLVIPQHVAIRSVVDTLVLIWADDRPADWINRARKIPF